MSHAKNLDAIIATTESKAGMDFIIVSTTSEALESFWQNRLEKGCGQICKEDAKILVIHEDWKGGAGNGLGTLYAIAKASLKSKQHYNVDLLKALKDGAAVGLYHTAGKGTRLAPLPGSESNNKPAVKLPGTVMIDDESVPITILEAVIRQTSIYAAARKSRVSVFWGDQVFIPSVDAAYDAVHHIDILAKLGTMPSIEEWEIKGLHKYGLIAVSNNGDAAQVEKISWETAQSLIEQNVIRVNGGIGVSLGSFSISHAMTIALMTEFAQELADKTSAMDTDPHFWMPLTLDETTYIKMMHQKGVEESTAKSHFARMQEFLNKFETKNPGAKIFGCVDVGQDCYWWDYGTIPDYVQNNLRILGNGAESEAMRRFYGITERAQGNALGIDVDVDENSILLNCDIKGGEISNSILIGVVADRIDVDNSILINVSTPDACGENVLLYNVAEALPIHMEDGAIRADAFVPGIGHLPMWTSNTRDGKEDWDTCLDGNGLSYADLHKANQSADMKKAAELAETVFRNINTILTVRL